METFESSDGTVIAFERSGVGPALILVGGALSDHSSTQDLASMLTPTHTVYCYDRRGRGSSGDSPPYSVDLEVEDLEALIAHTGATAAVFGRSSGAALALLAAAEGVAMDQVIAFEPPYIVDDSRTHASPDLPARVRGMIAAGRPGDAVERFLVEAVGMSPVAVAGMQVGPGWAAMESLATSIPHDLALMGDGSMPDGLARIAVPTLILDSSASAPWLRQATRAVAALVPHALHQTLDSPAHGFDAATVAQALVAFLS